MAEKNIRQAFGCAQHPKAGRNTQQITLTCTLLTLMNVNFFEQTLSFNFFTDWTCSLWVKHCFWNLTNVLIRTWGGRWENHNALLRLRMDPSWAPEIIFKVFRILIMVATLTERTRKKMCSRLYYKVKGV